LFLFSGTAGDAFSYNRGFPFSTKDRHNDGWPTGNCALADMGGWWNNRALGTT